MAKMNMFLHDYTDSSFAIGDTFRNPGFTQGNNLNRFNYVVANPMWNQDGYDEEFYNNDAFDRFCYGAPPKSSADWGWVQHMLSSLQRDGRAAIVLDKGAMSRGSGVKNYNKEREVRKNFVENDFIEAVILLPENLFYNTTAPGIVMLLNCDKSAERKGQVLLINASAYFFKGRPKNLLTDQGIAQISQAYLAWQTLEILSSVVTLQEIRDADYNLNPAQFVDISSQKEHRLLSEILADLSAATAEREKADEDLQNAFANLHLNQKRE